MYSQKQLQITCFITQSKLNTLLTYLLAETKLLEIFKKTDNLWFNNIITKVDKKCTAKSPENGWWFTVSSIAKIKLTKNEWFPHLTIQVRKEWFCLIQQCHCTLATNVSCRKGFHLARKKQLTMFYLILLFFWQFFFH